MALLAVITAFMEDMTSVTQEQIDQIGKTLLKKKDFKSPAIIVRDLTKDEVSAFTVVGLIQEKIEKLEQDHKKSKIDGTHTMESCELYATEVEKLNRRRDLFGRIFWESVRMSLTSEEDADCLTLGEGWKLYGSEESQESPLEISVIEIGIRRVPKNGFLDFFRI